MLKRVLLNAFLASVAINTVLGIWALISADFGPTQGKILATSFCISGAMLGVLVNGTPLTRKVRWPVPLVAAASAAAGFLLLIIVIWAEPDTDWWFKSLATLFIIAAAGTFLGLLALLDLRVEHTPLRLLHTIALCLLAATWITVIWVEPDVGWIGRVIGVESVVVAALTLTVPALARFQPPTPIQADEPPEFITCSHCGTRLDRHGQELPVPAGGANGERMTWETKRSPRRLSG